MEETEKKEDVGTVAPEPVEDATAANMRILKPAVQEVLELIANSKLPVGNNSKEEDDLYFPIAEKILEIWLREDLRFIDKETFFQLLLQVVEKLRNIVLGSVNSSFNKTMDIKYGKEFDEIRLSDIDRIIKSSGAAKDIPVA